MAEPGRQGPLVGLRVLAFGGIGPAPFCSMLLADLGAQVLRIDAPAPKSVSEAVPALGTRFDVLARGQHGVVLDLKKPAAVSAALRLLARADVLLEGFRPGVMERLGLGPDVVLAAHPRLVYGRVTGWGQDGPSAQQPGHDINYIARSGVLHSIGPAGQPPVFPLGIAGDYGGGGLVLAMGVLAAVYERQRSGKGQVVDAAMAEGSALLLAAHYGYKAAGLLQAARGENLLDGGAPFYGTYKCADGKYIALGAIEPQFYERLMTLCGFDVQALPKQLDAASWPDMKERLRSLFASRTRDVWAALLADEPCCATPVLDLNEAPLDAQNLARGAFVTVEGVTQPAPAPRFSRTPASTPAREPRNGPLVVLQEWGIEEEDARRWFSIESA